MLGKIYSIHKNTAKQEGDKVYYTLSELREWVSTQSRWSSLMKSIGKQPTVVRIDPQRRFTLDNLVVTDKLTAKKLVGEYNRHYNVNSKAVEVFDKDGNFVGKYPSIGATADKLGINKVGIQNVLAGRAKTSKGYIFKYSPSPA